MPYLLCLYFCLPVMLSTSVFRSTCEAQNHPWLPFTVVVGALGLNVFLNWIFIFGNLGVPALGLTGAGVATFLACVAQLVVMPIVALRSKRIFIDVSALRYQGIQLQDYWRYLRLAIPTGAQIFFELLTFSLAVILLGWIGAEAQAAHQIAIQYAALSFMVPLGLSFATAIRVGQVEPSDYSRIRRVAFASLGFAVFYASVAALILVTFHQSLPGFIVSPEVDDAEAVLRLAGSLLLVAAFFQVFDGLQVVAVGSLRGLQDVIIPAGLLLAGYWAVALPSAALFAFILEWGAVGVWLGLALGLGLAALLLILRFLHVTRS